MDYTREPIVETVITPKDGYRIAVRSSKNPGQEEFIVEALEVVSFGTNCFFRNLERPRAFMVPASDYEVLEVREARTTLKMASSEGVLKVPSGRESQKTSSRDVERRKPLPQPKEPMVPVAEAEPVALERERVEEVPPPMPAPEERGERRGDRRRGPRRRRGGREDVAAEERGGAPTRKEVVEPSVAPVLEPTTPLAAVSAPPDVKSGSAQPPVLSTLLPPPTTLIRDDLERLRRSDRYKGAFYIREPVEEPKEGPDDDDAPVVPLHLQEDEPVGHPVEELPPLPPQEEDIYKATPAPLDE